MMPIVIPSSQKMKLTMRMAPFPDGTYLIGRWGGLECKVGIDFFGDTPIENYTDEQLGKTMAQRLASARVVIQKHFWELGWRP